MQRSGSETRMALGSAAGARADKAGRRGRAEGLSFVGVVGSPRGPRGGQACHQGTKDLFCLSRRAPCRAGGAAGATPDRTSTKSLMTD